MLKHYERAKGEDGEYIKFGNQDIDTSKSHLNYNLAPDRSSQVDFIKKRTEEVRCLNRKDVNVMCSWVVTRPEGISKDEEEEFFKESYRFLEDLYGKENVVSAYVHNDETSPHIHFSFVPVVYDEKKDLYKVSAKELLTRQHLQRFHGDLDSHMYEVFGRNVGVLNDATKEGNRSVEELKKGTAVKELHKMTEKQKNMQSHIKLLSTKEKQLQSEIEALEGRVLSSKEVKDIKIEKTIFGNIKNISYDDMLNLKKTAEFVNEAMAIKKDLEKREKELQEKKVQLEGQAKEIKKIPLEHMSRMSKLEIENRELKKYKEAFDKLPPEIQEQLTPKEQNINIDIDR